jgi:hypothetical protein
MNEYAMGMVHCTQKFLIPYLGVIVMVWEYTSCIRMKKN